MIFKTSTIKNHDKIINLLLESFDYKNKVKKLVGHIIVAIRVGHIYYNYDYDIEIINYYIVYRFIFDRYRILILS